VVKLDVIDAPPMATTATGAASPSVRVSRIGSVAQYVRRTALWIPVATIALLTSPLFLTDRTYGSDWTLHLWLIRQQQLNIESLGHPGLFMSARGVGAFYPAFAFVGSGIYTVGGYLAILLGDRPILAYKLLYVVGFCLAFGGMTWLSRQFGLRGWRAQAPGMVLVTGAYVLTDFVGRGDFGEFIAVCSIPFVIAAGRAVVVSETRRRSHVLALTLGIFVFTGSHNLTLMFGLAFLAAVGVVTLLSVFPRWPKVQWKRWSVVAVAAAIGVGLNAWYLFADLAWGTSTQVSRYDVARLPSPELAQLGLLFNPFRPSDTFSPYWRDVRLALPWFFLAWVYVVARELWSQRGTTERRLVGGLAALIALYLTFIALQAPWRLLPSVVYNVQFTWRLHAYVLLATALLVLFVLRWEASARESQRRIMGAFLVAIIVFSLGAGVWQVWRARSEYVTGRREVATGPHFAADVVAARDHVPASWYPGPIYRDFSLPIVATASGRRVDIPVTAVHHSAFTRVLDVPDGFAPFDTNLAADSHFVRVEGIRIVGRTPQGSIVATRAPNVADHGPVRVTIEPARSPIVDAGALVSLVSLAALVALIGWTLAGSLGAKARLSRDR
jgi:hypothetical protein